MESVCTPTQVSAQARSVLPCMANAHACKQNLHTKEYWHQLTHSIKINVLTCMDDSYAA